MNLKKFLDRDEILLFVLGLAFLYADVNFKTGLGVFYAAGVVFYYLMREHGYTYPLFQNMQNPRWKEAILIGVIFTFGYLYIISSIVSALQPFLTAKTLGQGFATNFFEGNPIASFIVGSPLIGAAETYIFIGVGLIILMRIFQPEMRKKISFGLLLAFVMVGVGFAAFHITAYGANTAQMISAGIFMALSGMIAWKRKQLAEVMIAHILVNGILILISFKLLSLAPLMINFA